MTRNQKLLLALVLLVVGAASSPLIYHWGTRWLCQHWLSKAQVAMERMDYARAEFYAARILAQEPNQVARILAGEAAMLQGHDAQAIKYFAPMCEGTDADAIAAIATSAELQQRAGNGEEAERLYRLALQLAPDQVYAKHGLALLLSLQGRRRESIPFLFDLLREGEATTDELLLLGNPRALIQGDQVDRFIESDPDNPMWWLAQAQLDFRNSLSDRALELFRKVVDAMPLFPDGQAGLGLALLDTDSPDPFWKWYEQAPSEAQAHPDYWIALGLWAQRHQQQRAAIRCFWEALRRAPTYRLASYQLSVALQADGKPERAKPFAQQAVKLRKLIDTMDQLFTTRRNDITTMQKAARQLRNLGRYWEAMGWHRIVLTQAPNNSISRMAVSNLRAKLRADVPRVASDFQPALHVDFSMYPKPDIPRASAARTKLASEPQANTAIRFADVTRASGLDFVYFNGDDPKTLGRRMFEFTGGGVAVLDYDLDDWPDLYFTQGGHWPLREGDPVLRDRLYRNLGNGRFQDVTLLAGLGNERFSQGVAAGDFNEDGYPDLLIGNVGPNRLYRNNGDGTFTEVTQAGITEGDLWTTSCLIADLSGDGLADLFEVNYLAGNTAELMCRRTCSPAQFPAQADRFFLNQGDGTFVERTQEAGFTGEDGKGLAVSAFDFNDSGQLSLFVSNDTTANFFYINDQPRDAVPQFTESAMVRGLAFDREGQAQACMGIGVNDPNADGLLDVFIANFHREFNVLYEQMPGGFFADVSRERGLAEPSYQLLTFGTEFMDMDLDGDPDIIATNGHVDDFRAEGSPYHMPPTVFDNLGGHFAELSKSCGPFFEGTYLGRGLAVLDWNRDGRSDWTVSHLDSPAAILENRTQPHGHYLGITLVGTASQRDAAGATCWVTVGKRTIMQQLIGGGGYLSTNEKLLLFGLAGATKADKVEIKWPAGTRQAFRNVAGDQVYRFIEGQTQLHRLPRD